jgi:hypothetical protein
MSSNSSGNLFAPNERGAALFSACLSALAIVASWWSDANLTPHLVLTGRVGQLVRSSRLIGRRSSRYRWVVTRGSTSGYSTVSTKKSPQFGTQPDLRFYSPLQTERFGFLYCPDGARVLRHQGIDGQQRNTLNRRLCH